MSAAVATAPQVPEALARLREQAANGDRYEPPVLAGLDLTGQDLTKLDLSRANLEGTDLTGADLSGVRLRGANLRGAVLDEAKLGSADLAGADLTGARLEHVTAYETGFGKATLDGATLFGANLARATFCGSSLQGTDLRTARMPEARLRETDLRGANFFGCDMHACDLVSARVDEAVFDGAKLSAARLCGVSGYEDASWLGASVHDADFTGAYLLRRSVMDQNYLHEFRSLSRLNAVVYWAWWLTSDCGRSLMRWGAFTAVIALVFAGLFTLVAVDYGDHETALSPLYYSVVTLTTLGYGDVLPASRGAQILAMVEVVIGYVMLGGLLSIFSNKMARRAE